MLCLTTGLTMLTLRSSLVLGLMFQFDNIINLSANEITNSSEEKQCVGFGCDYIPTDVMCPFCVCGQSNKMTRIVGGWSTQVNEYPWMVALIHRSHVFCGGTLINDLYVLTAAHCLKSVKPQDLTVIISKHNTASHDITPTQTRKPSGIIKHPKYGDETRFNNDIALIKLNSRVILGHSIRPACLPATGEQFTHQEARVTGWGTVKEGGSVATQLMETRVYVFDNNECKNISNFPNHSLTSNMMCAGLQSGGRDSCQGDSGGPLLVTDTQSRLVVAGVVSWGIGCGRPNSPGVYTRVNHYLQWIIKMTRDACYCF